MEQNNELNVWHKEELVGKLWKDDLGRLGFKYADHWIQKGFSISQQLPLHQQEYSPETLKAHQFFANLLPEADARTQIVRDLKITNTDYELLKAIGGECAGALSILPLELNPSKQYSYKSLSEEEFNKILQKRGVIFNFNSQNNRPRLSLAGAQSKCPIFFNQKNQYFLPIDSAPSSHILKFEIPHFKNIPIYEFVLTNLAKQIGLPVVDMQLHNYAKHLYLLIKRYDCQFVFGDLMINRFHQEDFCQALGIGYEHKYQLDGGPSFVDCYQLIQQVSEDPIEDAENLLRWQIFNVLAGNSDGHAKNLSLLYAHNKTRLAPFYDLVCTRAIESVDSKLAMSVGGEYNPNAITQLHWKKFASECQLRETYLHKLISQIAENLLNLVSNSNEEFQNIINTYPAVQRIKIIVTQQCKKTLKLLA